jgi:hypothetical protein
MSRDRPAIQPPAEPGSTVRAAPLAGWLRPAALVLALAGLAWLILALAVLPGSPAWGYDYEAYLNAAVRLSTEGSLYQAETLAGPFRPGPYGLYLYPPPLGVAMGPFTPLDTSVGATAWFLLHVLALAVACALMPVRTTVRLLAFAAAAFSFTVLRDVVLGNVSVLLLVPLVVAWRWLDRPAGAVAMAVALAVRPTLGVLLMWQLLRGAWRAVAWTIGAGLVLIAASLPFVGLDGYLDYVAVVRNLGDMTGVERNTDLGSTLAGLGAGADVARLALFGGYAAAIAAILLGLRRDREAGFMVTLGASLLLAPLMWDHYLAALVLPAAFLAQRGRALGLLLPLLTWLPSEALPFLALTATILPLWARPAPEDATLAG